MTEEEKEQLRQRWKDQIHKIGENLGDLLISQDIIKEVSKIAVSNKRIQSSPFFFTWIQNNYIDSIVVGLGRLNDHDGRSISLHNSIKEIIEKPEVITRDYFVSRYDKKMQEHGIADRDFNMFADEGEQFVSKKRLRVDLKFLDDETKLIKVFRDKWIAHLDSNRPLKVLVTHNDVRKCLSALDEILCKYYVLIDGGGMSTAKPTLTFSWNESLKYPWIEMTEKEKQWRMEKEKNKD